MTNLTDYERGQLAADKIFYGLRRYPLFKHPKNDFEKGFNVAMYIHKDTYPGLWTPTKKRDKILSRLAKFIR